MITKFDLMVAQAIMAMIFFVIFYIIGNIPAMILSMSLSLTTMQYANDIEDNLE